MIYISVFLFSFGVNGQNINGIIGAISEKGPIEKVVEGVKRLGERKAFPTALGGGAYTSGNTTSNVYMITNLNGDVEGNVPGSLAGAKNLSNVTIQSNVAGYITFPKKTASFRGENVTFAFETAPAPGITLRFGTIAMNGSEMIMRHFKGRRGYGDKDVEVGKKPLKTITEGANINNQIIDHSSLSWTIDENWATGDDVNYDLSNFTYQNVLSGEAINRYGILINRGGNNLSFLRSAFIHIGNRIPESTHGEENPQWELINNLIYNYDRPTVASFGSYANVINNVYKAKETPAIPNMTYHRGYDDRVAKLYSSSDGAVFSEGNLQIGNQPYGMENSIWTANKAANRLNPSTYMPIPANEVEAAILYDVGATAWPDPVDTRLINEYNTNTGIRVIANEAEVGGFPAMANTAHPSGYWATGNRVSQAFKDAHGFTDDMAKPDFFTVNGLTFDNREFSGGSYIREGVTVFEYQGGALTGKNLYTWWDIFRFELAKDFETYKWQ